MSTSRRKILLMAGAGVVGCSTAAIAGVVAFVAVGEARYANRMYPGVRVDGEDFGGLTLLEARDRMENRWGTFAASPVVFRLGQRLWEPAGREIGVEVDYQTPLADAYAWGRRGGWGTRLGEQRRTPTKRAGGVERQGGQRSPPRAAQAYEQQRRREAGRPPSRRWHGGEQSYSVPLRVRRRGCTAQT